MPWTKNDLPPAAKNLSDKQKEVFVAAANAALKDGEDEGSAIAIGLVAAKKDKEDMKKSLLESISELIEKAFGESSKQQSPEILDEEMVSYEVIYEPFVKDAHGEWMSDKTIEKACENFNKNLESGVVKANLFHLKETEAFTIESSWIQKELDVQVVQTGELIKAGTWVAKIKYNDPMLWQLKKSGVVSGVSIGAKGRIDQETGEITNVSFDTPTDGDN